MSTVRGLIGSFLVSGLSAIAQTTVSQPPFWNSKPDLAAFERLQNDRLRAAQEYVHQITAVAGHRTIGNTLVPFDEAMRQLNAAVYSSSLMQQVHPDAAFRDRATAMTTKISSALTALSLDRQVYTALSDLDVSIADDATKYYVQRQLLEFRLAGVGKDDLTRAQIHKLQDKLAEDQSMFDRNIYPTT